MKIKKLNLVMTYPVNWSQYTVMRDYIQNFYDATGCERFGKDFSYTYDSETKTLVMNVDRDFSMDWLMYIGASSKRDDTSDRQIGKFGEGFKVASLIAYRDYHWDITMESRDWKIHVSEVADSIENTEVKVMAYEVEDRPFLRDAALTLKNIDDKAMEKFRMALGAFYYEENPNFGEVVVKESDYAVYFPAKGGLFYEYGALFAGMLERAAISAPLIVCNHSYKSDKDSREREMYLKTDISRCLGKVFSIVTPKVASRILHVVTGSWSGGSKFHYSFDWEDSVKLLIDRIAESKIESACFLEEYRNLLVADFASDGYGNKRKCALIWLHNDMECRNRRLVLHDFQKLGIEELDTLCRERGGYEQVRDANPVEMQYLEILNRIVNDVFQGYTCYDELPTCRIIMNRPPNVGSAYCIETSEKQKNCLGISVSTYVRTIQLRARLFSEKSFSEAVVVYMHELLHQFGGDSSAQFRKAITAMSLRMIQAADQLTEYQKEWEKVGTHAG